jgi:hypothetical protein
VGRRSMDSMREHRLCGWIGIATHRSLSCSSASTQPPFDEKTPYSARSTIRYVPRFWSRQGIDAQMYSIT